LLVLNKWLIGKQPAGYNMIEFQTSADSLALQVFKNFMGYKSQGNINTPGWTRRFRNPD
jgi:hypothetical protein